jgi:hypothetical protein
LAARAGAAAAVRQERERPLSAREIERFEATWTAILTQMGRRSAPAEEVERVTRQAAADLAVVRHRSEPPQRAGIETPTAEYTLTPRRGAEPAVIASGAKTRSFSHASPRPTCSSTYSTS